MAKTATLNLRVDPDVKYSAEEVLSKLGIPMSVAIDMYLKQISLTGSIPFNITLAPDKLNADLMTDEELRGELQKGYDDVKAGRVYKAEEVFKSFRRRLK